MKRRDVIKKLSILPVSGAIIGSVFPFESVLASPAIPSTASGLSVDKLNKALGQIEPKHPLAPEQELRVTHDSGSVTVSGATFSYVFNRENGLIGAVRVLGNDITGGTPIPDIFVAEQLDPNYSPYAARHEKQANLTVVLENPSQVAITSEGQYTSKDGRRFPLRYSITYDISIDGVVLVTVNNVAMDNCSFRWLTLSGGAIRSELAKFVNWMPEQSISQDTTYQFRPLSEITGEKILEGIWIPWFWLGNQNVGLELTTWEVSSQTLHRVNFGDSNDSEMFTVRRTAGTVRWDNFLVRRAMIFARPGWTKSGQFALAVTPSKKFDPHYAMFKGAHLGPHQHKQHLTLPDEGQIRTLAQNGYNLVVGMANWRSGEYKPLNDAELRRTIEKCHKYGMKIIPYITLVDLSHATEVYREHGEEWTIEPGTEYANRATQGSDPKADMAYRNDAEQETTLMCPGAEGWRTFWKQQVDRVIRDYDFDGIYFDLWYERMACENTRHGCGGRFRKATVLGSREMLMYAYNRLKAKDQHAIIKVNTNMLATALITSLVDLRLVGESTDASKMDHSSRQWLYTSYRLGESTEFLWANTGWNTAQRASFATMINFLPNYYQQRPQFEPRQAFDDFDVFRSFDDGTGVWHLGLSGVERLKVSPPEVVTNLVERNDALLVTLVNPRGTTIMAELPVPEGWLVCEPLAQRPPDFNGGTLKLELGGDTYRHIILVQKTARPRLLYSLGARRPATETFNQPARRLQLSVKAVEGALIRFAVYSPEPVKDVTNGRGESVPFKLTPKTNLLSFEVRHMPGMVLQMRF